MLPSPPRVSCGPHSLTPLDCHQKEEERDFSVISEAETMWGKQEDVVVKAAEEL